MPNYFGLDDFGNDDLNALQADDPAQQLAQVFGVDVLGAAATGRGWHVEGTLQALMADALAADMMFGADDPRAVAAKGRVVNKLRRQHSGGPSRQMQELQRVALAHQAGKGTFSSTGEANTSIKAEMLPIPRTVVPLNSQTTIAVRPIRSMQINTIRFPSDRAATAACRVEDISILGTSQLNGPGGIACSGLTEVRTAPILKGSTAQAGQDILITISNTTGVNQTIEGWFEGPDLVRVT
jgi:hypothetical protein